MQTPLLKRKPLYMALILGWTGVTATAAQAQSPDKLQLEEVVVTGVAGGKGQSKFETSYAISTMSAEDIAMQAPSGLADLVAQTPGIFVESSGGTLGNNVYTRGLPADNFRYIRALEDGLPTFEEGAGAFSNADIYSRVDETIERVEVVRGGSAAITSSNAPGSTINTVTRKGTEDQQGRVKLTTSDYGLLRADFNVSGPLTENILYHVGGHQKTEDGIRDPGFTASRGGQLRAGLNVMMDDGELYLGMKSIDDHNTFYTPMPMASSDKGLPGLDPGTGSLVSNDFGNIKVFDGAGNRNKTIDISDGVATNVDTFTVLFDKDINNAWSISNKFRRIKGNITFSAAFSGGNGFDDLSDELATLQAEDPATERLMFRYVNGGEELLERSQLPNNRLLDQGLWETEVDIDNIINDLQISHFSEFGGGITNDLVVGHYYSQFDQVQVWNWQSAAMEAVHQPRLLDIIGVDGNGDETIAYTDNGIWNHHSNLQEHHDDVTHTAIYLTDTVQLTNQLRVDVGVRRQEVDKVGGVAETTEVDLGDPSTIADDSVAVFTGKMTPYTFQDNETAWTLGANYELNSQLAFFGRFSEAFRFTPEFAQWDNCCNPTESDIELVEFGAKYSGDNLSAFITLFANEFPNVAFSTQIQDPDTNEIVTESAFASTEAAGVEWELSWGLGSNLDLNFSGFYQNIEYNDFQFSEFDESGGQSLINFSGNQIVRQPETVMTLRPVYYLNDGRSNVYATVMHTGKRYSDAANTIELPSYTTLDAGVTYYVSDTVSVQLVGSNLTDEIGITEGNPRTGTVVGGVSDVFVGRSIFGRSFKLSATMEF